MSHVVLQNNQLIVSENLETVFLFLSEIEKEILAHLHIQKNLKQAREKFTTIFSDFTNIAEILEKNGIAYTYETTHDSLSIIDDFHLNHNIRIITIALFAYLETIFCIVTVYNKEILDKKEIIKHTKRDFENLTKKYLFSNENEYFIKEKYRLQYVSWETLRDLRNSLTHFYSVSEKLSILENGGQERRNELEGVLNKETVRLHFITPEELYERIRGAVKILLIEWTNESKENSGVFSKKIESVIKVIGSHASKLVVTKAK